MINLDSKYIFSKKNIMPASELVKNTGKLVYNTEQVDEINDLLMKLFRKILYEEKITYDYLVFKYREYCRESLMLRPDQVQHKISNLPKTLYKTAMSFRSFKEIMESLGFPILKLTVQSIKNEELTTFTSE